MKLYLYIFILVFTNSVIANDPIKDFKLNENSCALISIEDSNELIYLCGAAVDREALDLITSKPLQYFQGSFKISGIQQFVGVYKGPNTSVFMSELLWRMSLTRAYWQDLDNDIDAINYYGCIKGNFYLDNRLYNFCFPKN